MHIFESRYWEIPIKGLFPNFEPETLNLKLKILYPDIHSLLKEYWGYDSFRPLQEDIIQSVLAGNDTLALMPTGGGKSVCFQVPGLALGGLTLIISPLVALMKDQVEHLRSKDIPAVALHSGLSYKEIDTELDNCIFGKYRFLYVSPERLQSDIFRARVAQMPVKLIAVDEAHCISQWGYDFRPEYLKISELRPLFPKVPIIAVTATATPDVVKDIQDKLLFAKLNVYSISFERPNLHYLVLQEENKLGRLLSVAQKTPGSGVVYMRSRLQTQKIADFLNRNGISATYYHAGLNHTERSQRQNRWMSGNTAIIVATNAFGMGIDKPDVRFVAHLDLPENLESYYQEAGRAGRDGQTAYCVLLYSPSDGSEALEKFDTQRVTAQEARQLLTALHSYYNIPIESGAGTSFDFDIQQFSQRFDWHPAQVYNGLKVLEQQGIVSVTEALYIPPKIKFLVDNYTLYEYQVKYPLMTEFVKTILRSYGGAFEQYVTISESEIARRTGLPKTEVIKGLERLAHNEIIDYIPQKDKPQLTFAFARGTELIDHRAIEERTALLLQKLKAVIQYAQQEELCRSRFLLEYFGEVTKENCGHCDVCIQLRKKISTADEFEDYSHIIEKLLAHGPADMFTLTQSQGLQHESRMADALRKLIESEQVEIKEGYVYWTGKRK